MLLQIVRREKYRSEKDASFEISERSPGPGSHLNRHCQLHRLQSLPFNNDWRRNNIRRTCIGVLGAGPFANHFIPLFKAHSLVEDVYLAERMKERRETKAEKFGITKTFDDYEKLLKGDVGVSL